MTNPSLRPLRAAALAALIAAGFAARPAPAQIPLEGAAAPHWIWSDAEGAKGRAAAQTRYFRKKFEIKENGSTLALDVAADDAFTLYLDGNEVLRGADWRTLRSYSARLPAGWHVLAAVGTNEAHGPAGFLVRGSVTPLG